MNETMPNVHNLTPQQKRELLARLLHDKARCSRSYKPSFAQERLWFIDQFQPGLAIYNIPSQLRFPGPMDENALQRALSEIVRRHEALRTTFHMQDGRPVQRISPAQPVSLPITDLRHLPRGEREAQAQQIAAKEATQHFELSEGPLFRAILIRLDDTDHILALTMHHIVSDGWSMGVLTKELGVLYDAFRNRRPSPLPELPLQYADYAEKQRDFLSGQVFETQLSYWKQQLAEAPAVLDLPTDRLRPAVQTFQGAWQPFSVPADVTRRLKQLSVGEHATLFMTLLAAFQLLLYRYSGQRDFVIGTPIAGRNRAEIEGLIGFFVNTLALRADLSGDPSFRELLARVRETTLGAFGHQDMPFEKLVEELQPDRNLSHSPLFQTMFVVQNVPTMPMQMSDAPDIDVESGGQPPIYAAMAKFDLTLSLWETPNALAGTLEYNTDLFDHTTMTRMIGHFQTLLRGVAADPDRRTSTLPILTSAERDTMLVQWNATEAEYPRDRCVHELFEERVDETPDAIALVYDDSRLTYRELDRRANQVAHHLRDLGVGKETIVGVCLERSLEMVVGILAIFKAGGAYVPLDPEHPRERLAFMIQDSQSKVLLTQQRFADNLDFVVDTPVIHLDSDERVRERPSTRPEIAVSPDDLLAVFYTSGSTGKPKGSLGPGRGYSNLLHWFGSAHSFVPDDNVLLMTPFTFDASFKNLMTPLLFGATTVLAAGASYDTEQMVKDMVRHQVSVTFATPSLLYALLDVAEKDDYHSLSSLRLLFFGGEPTEIPRLRRWLDSPNCKCQLVHLYGPSECSDVSTSFIPTDEELATWKSLPIGKPIANVAAYVVDSELNPLPIGIPGELCIGGLNVTRGYLDRPQLTAEKFVSNPFRKAESMYRTGDLVRWLPSGDLEFLGRTDRQVKIRGIRIELGEIESLLSSHPAVRDAVVVAWTSSVGKRLIGYVVPRDGQQPALEELRVYLKQQLPDFMVPEVFVVLDALPLSPNGKVDRSALPEPDTSTSLRQDMLPPRTPVEKMLADIWRKVLDIDQFGVHENFFSLGGHSLMATQVISRIREAFRIEVPLRKLFERPTIAELATALSQEPDTAEQVNKVAALLEKVSALSDAEADALLRDKYASQDR